MRKAESESEVGIGQIDALAAELMLGNLTSQLVAVQTDLVHFPISYYFRSSHERFELPSAMPYLLCLAESSDSADCAPSVRMRANMLHSTIDDFSGTVGERFLDLPSASTEGILTAYARDNLHTLPELESFA